MDEIRTLHQTESEVQTSTHEDDFLHAGEWSLDPADSCESIASEELLQALRRYPSSTCKQLQKKIAAANNVKERNVIVGRGVLELFELVLHTVRPKDTMIVEPTFSSFKNILQMNHMRARSFFIRDVGYRVVTDELLDVCSEKVDFLVLANPNWPTGQRIDREVFLKFLAQVHLKRIFVVIDESFIDWERDGSVVSDLREDSHFIILRSFRSFYGLAGAQVAYAIAPRRLIERVQDRQVSWSVSAVGEKLAEKKIADTAWAKKRQNVFGQEIDKVNTLLAGLRNVEFWPTTAPFFMIEVKEGDPEVYCSRLRSRGIRARRCGDISGLTDRFIAVELGSSELNDMAMHIICELDGLAVS